MCLPTVWVGRLSLIVTTKELISEIKFLVVKTKLKVSGKILSYGEEGGP